MKELDVKAAVAHMQKYPEQFPNGFIDQFGGSVAEYTAKAKIKAKLETRDHKFQDGEMGEVCQKLTLEIDFSDLNLQPHNDFEEDFTAPILEAIANNINGLFENAK